MTKQNRSRHKRSQQGIAISKKWLIGVGLLISLIIIGVVIALAARSTSELEVTGAPAIEVEQAVFNLGDMHFNQPAQVTYRIRNVGDQPLEITETPTVEVLEGC